MCIIENVELYIDPEMMIDVVCVRYMSIYFVVVTCICFNYWDSRVIVQVDYGCILILHLLFLC